MLEDQLKILEILKKFKGSIKHLVKLSAVGVDKPFTLSQWLTRIEREIKESGIPYTFLRPNSFHQNVGSFYGGSIKSGGAFYGPLGKGKVAYVDVRDVANVSNLRYNIYYLYISLYLFLILIYLILLLFYIIYKRYLY